MAFLAEAAAVALVGGALGIGLAMLTPLVHFSTVNWATGQELAFRFTPSAESLYMPALLGMAVGILGGLLPAIRAARLDPVGALRA